MNKTVKDIYRLLASPKLCAIDEITCYTTSDGVEGAMYYKYRFFDDWDGGDGILMTYSLPYLNTKCKE